MAWIQIHQQLKDHRKLLAAADILEINPVHMLGLLVSFWLWALDNTPSGELQNISNRVIARAAQWNGDPDEFVEAMKSSSFFDYDIDGKVKIHDWSDYAGKLIEQREAEKQRSRRRRESAAEDKNRNSAEAAGVPQSFRRNSDGKGKETEGTPSGSFVTNQPTITNHNQPTNSNRTNQPTSEAQALQEERFAEFWKAYPKKVGKAACLKIWKKLKPTKELHERILLALEEQKRSEQWRKQGGQYIPNPSTWLNQGRWDDEPTEVSEAQTAPASGTLGALASIVAEEEREEL